MTHWSSQSNETPLGRLTVWDRSDLCGTVDGKQRVTVFSGDTILLWELLRGLSWWHGAEWVCPHLQLLPAVVGPEEPHLGMRGDRSSLLSCSDLWSPTQTPRALLIYSFLLSVFLSIERVSKGASGKWMGINCFCLYAFPKMTCAESPEWATWEWWERSWNLDLWRWHEATSPPKTRKRLMRKQMFACLKRPYSNGVYCPRNGKSHVTFSELVRAFLEVGPLWCHAGHWRQVPCPTTQVLFHHSRSCCCRAPAVSLREALVDICIVFWHH